jgi:hypothetical protein
MFSPRPGVTRRSALECPTAVFPHALPDSLKIGMDDRHRGRLSRNAERENTLPDFRKP